MVANENQQAKVLKVTQLGFLAARELPLHEHLRRLHAHKRICRQRTGKQNFAYKVNLQRFENLEQSLETRRMLLRILENKRRFKSFPIDEQTMYVTNILTLADLYRLKLAVQCILEPKKSHENSLQYLFTNRFYDFFETWLLQNCKDLEESAQASLNMIERNIVRFTQVLFDKIPETSQSNKNQRIAL
jgi:hypothetical protein